MKGSINEIQTQIELAQRLRIMNGAEATALIVDADEIGRMLNGLVRSFQR